MPNVDANTVQEAAARWRTAQTSGSWPAYYYQPPPQYVEWQRFAGRQLGGSPYHYGGRNYTEWAERSQPQRVHPEVHTTDTCPLCLQELQERVNATYERAYASRGHTYTLTIVDEEEPARFRPFRRRRR